MPSPSSMRGFRSFSRDSKVLDQKIPPETFKRVLRFAAPYARILAFFLLFVILDAAVGVGNPLLYRLIINQGILQGNTGLVIHLSILVAFLAIADAGFTFAQRGIAARIGHGMLYDLRVKVFAHIQSMSIAFFTRTRTGALVSRLDNDVSAVRDAVTDILSSVIGNTITVVLTLGAMFILSWQLTLVSLVMIPLFILPARYVSTYLQKLTRESYNIASEMSDTMVERFNVSGAQLAKVFGEPAEEEHLFEERAGRVAAIGIQLSTYTRLFFISLGLTASLAVAITYGWGGTLAIRHVLDVGTLVAMASYLARLYGPLTSLSNVQVDVMTALVSFDRVFEILDLKPLVQEKAGAVGIPAGPTKIEFSQVSFRYPTAEEVSLASLESVATLSKAAEHPVLKEVSFTIQPGQMVALVGSSGAGKTTIAQLIPRFYDVQEGAIKINGVDVRDATFVSLRRSIGMVMQDSHMFHDTVRGNLLYAKPDATEVEVWSALEAAQIMPLVQALSQGLDTVIGERGHRLSGGEKQRLAIARLLLKAPDVVILDEATAHLDSESEAAIQKAFTTALAGRTSLVIAHRLSTVLHADQILVIEAGRVVEQGKHAELLAEGKLYAELYKKQFAKNGE